MEDMASRIVDKAISLGCQDAVADVVTNRSYQIRFARNEPVISDLATAAADRSDRPGRSAPSGVGLGGSSPGRRRLTSRNTSSSPRPWMNCMT